MFGQKGMKNSKSSSSVPDIDSKGTPQSPHTPKDPKEKVTSLPMVNFGESVVEVVYTPKKKLITEETEAEEGIAVSFSLSKVVE